MYHKNIAAKSKKINKKPAKDQNLQVLIDLIASLITSKQTTIESDPKKINHTVDTTIDILYKYLTILRKNSGQNLEILKDETEKKVIKLLGTGENLKGLIETMANEVRELKPQTESDINRYVDIVIKKHLTIIIKEKSSQAWVGKLKKKLLNTVLQKYIYEDPKTLVLTRKKIEKRILSIFPDFANTQIKHNAASSLFKKSTKVAVASVLLKGFSFALSKVPETSYTFINTILTGFEAIIGAIGILFIPLAIYLILKTFQAKSEAKEFREDDIPIIKNMMIEFTNECNFENMLSIIHENTTGSLANEKYVYKYLKEMDHLLQQAHEKFKIRSEQLKVALKKAHTLEDSIKKYYSLINAKKDADIISKHIEKNMKNTNKLNAKILEKLNNYKRNLYNADISHVLKRQLRNLHHENNKINKTHFNQKLNNIDRNINTPLAKAQKEVKNNIKILKDEIALIFEELHYDYFHDLETRLEGIFESEENFTYVLDQIEAKQSNDILEKKHIEKLQPLLNKYLRPYKRKFSILNTITNIFRGWVKDIQEDTNN